MPTASLHAMPAGQAFRLWKGHWKEQVGLGLHCQACLIMPSCMQQQVCMLSC